MQCLLLAWCLSAFIQGITGFGVPVAIVAPLMLAVGFEPVTAAVATLVGHAWSVTFGSMAGSFYALQLVTKLPARESAYWIGAMLFVPTVLTGFAVAHIYGGVRSMAQGAPAVILTGVAMGLTQWALPVLGAPQSGSVAAGLVGGSYRKIRRSIPDAACLNVRGGDADMVCARKSCGRVLRSALRAVERLFNLLGLPFTAFLPALDLVFRKPPAQK